MSTPLLVTFAGGSAGEWRVQSMKPVRGDPLADVSHVAMGETVAAIWNLRGVVSNERYATRAEHERLVARQEALGRPEATRAALIPIRKSDEWWSLSQDQRREIFEERSRHIATGLEYLPPIARRLHHSRDLGEPFDFLTWFEYAPEHADAFEELVHRLRETEEWRYVEREVDVRLSG
jgi:chlorite dismutase